MKQSKYRIRKEKLKRELKEYEKSMTLTKKERKMLHDWVNEGHSPYEGEFGNFSNYDYIGSVQAQKELDEMLKGFSKSEIDYIYSYCMNWDPIMDDTFFDYDKLFELDLNHLPVETKEVEYGQTLDIPDDDLPF